MLGLVWHRHRHSSCILYSNFNLITADDRPSAVDSSHFHFLVEMSDVWSFPHPNSRQGCSPTYLPAFSFFWVLAQWPRTGRTWTWTWTWTCREPWCCGIGLRPFWDSATDINRPAILTRILPWNQWCKHIYMSIAALGRSVDFGIMQLCG